MSPIRACGARGAGLAAVARDQNRPRLPRTGAAGRGWVRPCAARTCCTQGAADCLPAVAARASPLPMGWPSLMCAGRMCRSAPLAGQQARVAPPAGQPVVVQRAGVHQGRCRRGRGSGEAPGLRGWPGRRGHAEHLSYGGWGRSPVRGLEPDGSSGGGVRGSGTFVCHRAGPVAGGEAGTRVQAVARTRFGSCSRPRTATRGVGSGWLLGGLAGSPGPGVLGPAREFTNQRFRFRNGQGGSRTRFRGAWWVNPRFAQRRFAYQLSEPPVREPDCEPGSPQPAARCSQSRRASLRRW
ncbi:hypothetical protein SCALM49S_01741 [Streptomyces californicus]